MQSFTLVQNIMTENGKTIKENNLNMEHKIPLGALVEVTYKSYDEEEDNYETRLFVVNQSRDCDGTPLYDLSFNKKAYKNLKEMEMELNNSKSQEEKQIYNVLYSRIEGSIIKSYSEESLHLIKE